MKQKEKQKYITPAIEVIRMENEGIMASSLGGMPSTPWGCPRRVHPQPGEELPSDTIDDNPSDDDGGLEEDPLG